MDDDLANVWGMVSDLQQHTDKTKQHIAELETELDQLQTIHAQCPPPNPPGTVLVHKTELEMLSKLSNKLTHTLPQVLNCEIVQLVSDYITSERGKSNLRKELQAVTADRDHWKSRCEETMSELKQEKEEKFALKFEVQDLSDQLSQQTEYCTSMGVACCTLLWRVSRCQESIQSILVGAKVDEFLAMVSSTLQSYMATYKDDPPQDSAEESQFIIALCGIITNVAASPFGRDFLMKHQHGCPLVDTFLTVLSEAQGKQWVKVKNLVLMCLFNISINQKGLRYLSAKPGIIGLVAWHMQVENSTENRINSLKLIQSLLYDQEAPSLILEANEVLCSVFLQQLASDECESIRNLAMELIADLKALNANIPALSNQPEVI